MSTDIRPEISEKSKYHIGRHRYYELKHFCLQYPEWKKAYIALGNWPTNTNHGSDISSSDISNPTERLALTREAFLNKMELVEKAAYDADPVLSHYILTGVTEGYSYPYLHTMMHIPCCRDSYYELYRKFFFLLSKLRK